MKTKDYRGKSWYDIFPLSEGQINFTHNYKGTIRAFHRHQKQTDYWFCAYGEARVIIEGESTYLSQGDLIVIPPNKWHGLEALTDFGLLYWTTEKFNEGSPDEERAPFDKWQWDKEWK